MIDVRYKPMWLPQVNSPFTYTLDMLDKEGVGYNYVQVDPEELFPSQGIVAQDKISQIDVNNIMPIWVCKDNKILDGHHRYIAALSRSLPVKAIKIMLPQKDAARVLNKIQDIYEFENQDMIVDEVVAQDQINLMNDIDSGVSTSEFLATLENEDHDEKLLLDNGKKTKIKGYRKNSINEKSLVGNFFSLKNNDGYQQYDIEFDNLLDTNDLDVIFKSDQSPVFLLAKIWFPNKNFDDIAKRYDVQPVSLINRAVAEKAKQMGYDGIKYGDIMIQGLN